MALPARLFCDTPFFYACFDQHDVNHERAKQRCVLTVSANSQFLKRFERSEAVEPFDRTQGRLLELLEQASFALERRFQRSKVEVHLELLNLEL